MLRSYLWHQRSRSDLHLGDKLDKQFNSWFVKENTFSRLTFCVETKSEVKTAKTPTWKFSPLDCTWYKCPKMVKNQPKWDDEKIQTKKWRALGLKWIWTCCRGRYWALQVHIWNPITLVIFEFEFFYEIEIIFTRLKKLRGRGNILQYISLYLRVFNSNLLPIFCY